MHAEPAATRPISLSPSLNEMPLLRSALSWPCHRCSHSNDSNRNKKRCSSCQAWRDGLAPLSAKGGGSTSTSGAAASDVGLVDDDATCHDENGPPNYASPHRGGSPTKRGEKRKPPSRGLGGVWCPPPLSMPPALRSTRSITPPAPPSECRGIYHVGFFGPALTFAAKSMEHTANQLR